MNKDLIYLQLSPTAGVRRRDDRGFFDRGPGQIPVTVLWFLDAVVGLLSITAGIGLIERIKKPSRTEINPAVLAVPAYGRSSRHRPAHVDQGQRVGKEPPLSWAGKRSPNPAKFTSSRY